MVELIKLIEANNNSYEIEICADGSAIGDHCGWSLLPSEKEGWHMKIAASIVTRSSVTMEIEAVTLTVQRLVSQSDTKITRAFIAQTQWICCAEKRKKAEKDNNNNKETNNLNKATNQTNKQKKRKTWSHGRVMLGCGNAQTTVDILLLPWQGQRWWTSRQTCKHSRHHNVSTAWEITSDERLEEQRATDHHRLDLLKERGAEKRSSRRFTLRD